MSGRAEPADAEIGKPLEFVIDAWHIYAKMTVHLLQLQWIVSLC